MSKNAVSADYKILTQYVKNSSFANYSLVNTNSTNKPQVSLDFKVEAYPKNENLYEVVIDFIVKAIHDDQKLYDAKLTYAAIAQIDCTEKEDIREIALVNCPHFIFPEARNVLSTMTRDAGHTPLVISSINFMDLYQKKHMNN